MKGRTFGRYRIVESLGEGAMGTLGRTKNKLLGRSVALELLAFRLEASGRLRGWLLDDRLPSEAGCNTL